MNTAQVDHQPRSKGGAWPDISFLQWLHLWIFVFTGPGAPQARWIRRSVVDGLVVCFTLALPWSTTAASAFSILLVLAIPASLEPRTVVEGLRRPSLLLPLCLVALAALGTLWAWPVDWWERLHALGKMSKLLLIPLLFCHFQASSRPAWGLFGFALSNLFLLLLSYLVATFPELWIYVRPRAPGVPIRNYIDQSQGFALLAFVLSGLGTEFVRRGKSARSLAPYLFSAALLANLAFVNVARSAFAYIPVMLAVFARRYARGWYLLALLVAFAAVGAAIVASSPNLQRKLVRIPGDLSAYQTNSMSVGDDPASGAQRLTFWRESLAFIRSAPIIGHGTGSIRLLFTSEAQAGTGLASLVVADPHNQTLNVAIQWGLVGCFLLFAMWGAHLWLFREALLSPNAPFVAWLGLLAVAQNIASSLFNSHLQDFYPGWLYVFAIGTAGGALHRLKP